MERLFHTFSPLLSFLLTSPLGIVSLVTSFFFLFFIYQDRYPDVSPLRQRHFWILWASSILVIYSGMINYQINKMIEETQQVSTVTE